MRNEQQCVDIFVNGFFSLLDRDKEMVMEDAWSRQRCKYMRNDREVRGYFFIGLRSSVDRDKKDDGTYKDGRSTLLPCGRVGVKWDNHRSIGTEENGDGRT